MRCKYCNAEIKEGLKFCTQCGKKLVEREKKEKELKQTINTSKENKGDIGRGLMGNLKKPNKIGNGIMGVILLGVMVWMFLHFSNASSFKFNSNHVKFLRGLGIEEIGTVFDESDGSKSFYCDDEHIYVYLDKNNGIKAVKFGYNKEVLWDDVSGKKKSLPKKKVVQQKETLKDVKKWYISQKSFINGNVQNSWDKNPVFSNGRIISNEFYFGNDGGWYDCHYTVWYYVDVQGIPCKGEMRIFLKYKGEKLNVWSHSVFEISTGTRIYRDYDEKYEKIIEDYYKYLVKNYS